MPTLSREMQALLGAGDSDASEASEALATSDETEVADILAEVKPRRITGSHDYRKPGVRREQRALTEPSNVPLPAWMNDPSLLPKRPPGK